MIHSSGGSTNGPMGFERPGSLGGRIGFLVRDGVMAHWNCRELFMLSSRLVLL